MWTTSFLWLLGQSILCSCLLQWFLLLLSAISILKNNLHCLQIGEQRFLSKLDDLWSIFQRGPCTVNLINMIANNKHWRGITSTRGDNVDTYLIKNSQSGRLQLRLDGWSIASDVISSCSQMFFLIVVSSTATTQTSTAALAGFHKAHAPSTATTYCKCYESDKCYYCYSDQPFGPVSV